MPNWVASGRIEFLRGNPSGMEEELVDAASEQEFESMLSNLQQLWDDSEKQYNNPPQLVYFELQRCSRIFNVEAFENCYWSWSASYTNVESLNQAIKQQVKYKAEELSRFVKEIIESEKSH